MISWLLILITCLLTGVVAAALWPRRDTPEARAFVTVAVATAALVAGLRWWSNRRS